MDDCLKEMCKNANLRRLPVWLGAKLRHPPNVFVPYVVAKRYACAALCKRQYDPFYDLNLDRLTQTDYRG